MPISEKIVFSTNINKKLKMEFSKLAKIQGLKIGFITEKLIEQYLKNKVV